VTATPVSAPEPRPSARRTLWQLVAILGGAFLLQIAGAALGLSVPLRMALDGRPAELVGLAGSAGAMGFLGGCLAAGFLVRPIGHIRAFAVLAALAGPAIAQDSGVGVDLHFGNALDPSGVIVDGCSKEGAGEGAW
jgi:hypothetical protein